MTTKEVVMYPKPTDLRSRMQELLVELLGVDPAEVRPSTRLKEDLEADELDLIELIMAIEDEFELEIPDEDVVGSSARTKGGKWRLAVSSSGDLFAGDWKLRTVGDVEEYVRRRLQEA
jgi:acyl carrier protein